MVDSSKWVPSHAPPPGSVCIRRTLGIANKARQDALKPSDDSDIEVHPNVDKPSFIEAKQSQVHIELQQQKLQIEAFKHQRIVNDGLAQRLSMVIAALRSHNTASVRDTNINPSDMASKVIMELAMRNPEEDTPPPRPEGASDADSPPLPTYSKMAAEILDEANKALGQLHIEDPNLRFEALAEELRGHARSIALAQRFMTKRLGELEQQAPKKITSDNHRVGVDTSHVSESALEPAISSSSRDTKVELLNPKSPPHEAEAEAERDLDEDDEEQRPRPSPAATRFAQIQSSDYRASQEFLASHPEILHEKETEGLLLDAYFLLLNQGDQAQTQARQYTHQALMLRYCRFLGRDRLALFFKGMARPELKPRVIFEEDVAGTFQWIQDTAERDAKEREEGELVERVQLFVCAGGEGPVEILVPLAGSENEEEREARATFESFSPEMRAALETGSLDEVNEVLADMDPDEGENLTWLLANVSFPDPHATIGTLLTVCSFLYSCL